MGANGGIYSLRRELFIPLNPARCQVDDFVWPMLAQQSGKIGVYAGQAIASEDSAPSIEAEFVRKTRIATGDFNALWECRKLLNPFCGWIAFAFWSHKVLRWLAPFFLLGLLVTNVLLSEYRWLLVAQVVFYGVAGVGYFFSKQKHVLARVLRIPYYFAGSNVALLIGCYKCLTGRQRAAWTQKAHRSTEC